MSKNTKRVSLLCFVLGAIVAFGAIMSAGRSLSSEDPVESSNASSNIETNDSSGLNGSNSGNVDNPGDSSDPDNGGEGGAGEIDPPSSGNEGGGGEVDPPSSGNEGSGGEVDPPSSGNEGGGEVDPPSSGNEGGGEVDPPASGNEGSGGEVDPPASGNEGSGEVNPPSGGNNSGDDPSRVPSTENRYDEVFEGNYVSGQWGENSLELPVYNGTICLDDESYQNEFEDDQYRYFMIACVENYQAEYDFMQARIDRGATWWSWLEEENEQGGQIGTTVEGGNPVYAYIEDGNVYIEVHDEQEGMVYVYQVVGVTENDVIGWNFYSVEYVEARAI